jgi:hypothetical protein
MRGREMNCAWMSHAVRWHLTDVFDETINDRNGNGSIVTQKYDNVKRQPFVIVTTVIGGQLKSFERLLHSIMNRLVQHNG